jgi:hypothetical protein
MDFVSVDELIRYCRADDDEETHALMEDLGESAEAYLIDNGADPMQMGPAELKVWTLCVKALTLHYYDNPGGAEFPPGLRQLVNRVKLAAAARRGSNEKED